MLNAMKAVLIFALIPAAGHAAEKSVQVSAIFRAEIDSKNWIEIEPSEEDSRIWVITAIKACETFPCSAADMKTQLGTALPTLISDQRASDGDLRIRLSKKYTLVERNFGFGRPTKGPQTPYVLEVVTANGLAVYPVQRLDGFHFGK